LQKILQQPKKSIDEPKKEFSDEYFFLTSIIVANKSVAKVFNRLNPA
jgi:hypothetical protein